MWLDLTLFVLIGLLGWRLFLAYTAILRVQRDLETWKRESKAEIDARFDATLETIRTALSTLLIKERKREVPTAPGIGIGLHQQ